MGIRWDVYHRATRLYIRSFLPWLIYGWAEKAVRVYSDYSGVQTMGLLYGPLIWISHIPIMYTHVCMYIYICSIQYRN